MKVALVTMSAVLNNQPDAQGKQRLDKALQLFENYHVDFIILSGGKRKNVQLLDVFLSYLLEKGVPKERIWVEPQSNTTASSLQLSSERLLNEEFKVKDVVESVVIITDFFQMYRISLLRRKIYWPWKTRKIITGVYWRYLHLEPIKLLLNLLDPDERSLGWFKKMRENSNR